jgi:hypothetical protein
VFGASLLVYGWGFRVMARAHTIAGITIFALLILFSGAGLFATVTRRPSRPPR